MAFYQVEYLPPRHLIFNLHSWQVGINCSLAVFGMDDAEYVDVVAGNEYILKSSWSFIKQYWQPEFAGEDDRGQLHQDLEGAEGEVIIANEFHSRQLQTSQPLQPQLAHDYVAPVRCRHVFCHIVIFLEIDSLE